MKECRTCKQILPETDFLRYKTGNKSLWLDCKQCCWKTKRERYRNDPKRREKAHLQLLRWRRSHKDQTNATTARSYQRNIIKRRKRACIWNLARYYKNKHDPVFKMLLNQHTRIVRVLHRNQVKKSKKTIKYLGCTAVQLKDYLAGKFAAGMTWENHGFYGWHVDHVKPLSSFDFRDEAQIMAAFHFTNLQPLWWYENLKKGDRVAVA